MLPPTDHTVAPPAQVPWVDLKDISENGLGSYLGPTEAAHGYRKAIAALRRMPEAAGIPRPDSEWLPLHTLLVRVRHAAPDVTCVTHFIVGQKDTGRSSNAWRAR